jgi:hypothetical protein
MPKDEVVNSVEVKEEPVKKSFKKKQLNQTSHEEMPKSSDNS